MILPEGLSLEEKMSGADADYRVLRVLDPGIIDEPADYVILHAGRDAHDGELVLAVVDCGRAAFGRLYREEGAVRLESHGDVETFDEGRILIQGVVAGVIRRY